MKKIFTFLIGALALSNAIQAQTCTAVPVVTLNSAPGTPMMISFNPAFNLYYASSGGGACNSMTTYSITGGAPISNTSVCYDARGTWWNPNTNTLEGNGYNGSGIYTITLSGLGIPTGGGAFSPPSNTQPDAQSMGSYDPSTNNIIYYYNGTLVKRNRTTNVLAATVAITGLPVGIGNLNIYCGFFTGIAGQEYAVFDYVNRRAYCINYNTGAYVSTIQFPPSAGAPTYYNLSYSNGLYFICNGSTWVGFQAGISASASPVTICSGASATLNANNATNYTWTPGNLNTQSIVVTPTITTVYSVAATPTTGCLSMQTLTINVNPAPSISVTSGSICSGQSFTMVPSGANTYTFQGGNAIVSPTANATYTVVGTSTAGCVSNTFAVSNITVYTTPTITVNSGSICTGGSFTISPSGANTYSIQGGVAVVNPTVNTNYTVVGTSTAGCSSQVVTSSVTVNGTPIPTITVNSGSICAGQSFTMNPSGAASYSFQGGNAVVSPTSTTSYTVVGTNSVGCVSNTAAVSNVTVGALPTLSVAGTGTICKGSTATFTASGANTYSWNTGASTSTLAQSPTVTTNYTVMGTSAQGCSSTYTFALLVDPCTGINEANAGNVKLSIYPNPTNGEITISFNTQNEKSIEICDYTGKVLYSDKTVQELVKVNMTNFSAGIYFVKVKSANDSQTIKVVKQ